MATCPFCAETIPSRLAVCPLCDSDLRHGVGSGGSTRTESGGGSKTSWVLILGILAAVGFVMVGILVALLLPAVSQARGAARMAQCRNNLKQIALALHNYHDTYQAFPPAYTVDEQGRPLHSWRSLILPYMDEQALYNEIDFSQPWDSPTNSRLHYRMPRTFACPEDQENHQGMTHYLAVVGPDCLMTVGQSRRIQDVIDGLSNTLMVGESQTAVKWMEPRDIPFETLSTWGDPQGFSGMHHRNGVAGAMAMGDGAVMTYDANNTASMKALSTINGGEEIR